MRIKGLTRIFRDSRATSTPLGCRFAQNADHFGENGWMWGVLYEVVCVLGAIPPRTAAAPPPIGGNCIIRATTRRRHAVRAPLMLQNPHHHWCGGCGKGWWAWLWCPWAVAGPGRASRRRAERSSRRGRLAGGPPPTGTQSSPARQGAAAPGTPVGPQTNPAGHSKGPEAPQRLGPHTRVCQLLTG